MSVISMCRFCSLCFSSRTNWNTMMQCKLAPIGQPNEHGRRRFSCTRPGCCIVTGWTPDPPEKITTVCLMSLPLPNGLECVHIGKTHQMQKCPTCTGDVRIKIFPCSIHSKCQLSSLLEGIQSCSTCMEFEEGTTSE